MATVVDMINATYRHLTGTQRAEMDQLAINVDTVQTTFTFQYGSAGFSKGDYLSLDDEIVFVWAVDPQSKTAQVQRGMAGTIKAVHAGSLVERNPRFPKFFVRQALLDEIKSWGEQVWTTDTVDVTATTNHRAIQVPSVADDFLFGLELVRSPRTGQDAYIKIGEWEIQRGVPQFKFLNEIALILTRTPCDNWTGKFTYALPFNVEQFTDTINLELAVRLPPAFQDIPPMGAVSRLMAGKDVLRSFTEAQGEPRDAQEVGLGAQGLVAQRFRAMADARISSAATELVSQYPWRRR